MLSSRPVPAHTNTKTPSRNVIRSTYQAENANYPGTTRKGASNLHTPFHSTSSLKDVDAGDTLQSFKPGSSPVKQQQTLNKSKALQDKTPFPNRGTNFGGGKALQNTPLPSIFNKYRFAAQSEAFNFNFNTPALHSNPADDDEGSLLSTPLPSSARRHSRAPRSSRGFETPITSGRHWDVSDIDINMELDNRIVEDAVAEMDSDDDEIEYMPPKVEVPYQPPFDFELPDFKDLGTKLFNLRATCPLFGADNLINASRPYECTPLEEKWEDILSCYSSDEDPDDPFVQVRKAREAAAAAQTKGPTAKPGSRRQFTSAVSAKPGVVQSKAAAPRKVIPSSSLPTVRMTSGAVKKPTPPTSNTTSRSSSSKPLPSVEAPPSSNNVRKPVPSSSSRNTPSSTTGRINTLATTQRTVRTGVTSSKIPPSGSTVSTRVRSSTVSAARPATSMARVGNGWVSSGTTTNSRPTGIASTARTGTLTSRAASRAAPSAAASRPRPASAAANFMTTRGRSMTLPTKAVVQRSGTASFNTTKTVQETVDVLHVELKPLSLEIPSERDGVEEFLFDV